MDNFDPLYYQNTEQTAIQTLTQEQIKYYQQQYPEVFPSNPGRGTYEHITLEAVIIFLIFFFPSSNLPFLFFLSLLEFKN
mgnify:CR=1 FL=1